MNNEIHNLPYSGVTIGWGWGSVDAGGSSGYTEPATPKDNIISHNHIYDFCKSMRDAGGAYILGAQPGMYISNNYIHDSHNEFGLLYLDQGTQHTTIEKNVLGKSFSSWIIAQPVVPPFAKYNVIRNNYTSVAKFWVHPENNYMFNNTLIFNNKWPEEANEIMKKAGIEPTYQDIKTKKAGDPEKPALAKPI